MKKSKLIANLNDKTNEIINLRKKFDALVIINCRLEITIDALNHRLSINKEGLYLKEAKEENKLRFYSKSA